MQKFRWSGKSSHLYAETQDNGFFKFEWSPVIYPGSGWHKHNSKSGGRKI